MKFGKSLVILSAFVFIFSTIMYFTQEELTVIGDTSFLLLSLFAALALWETTRTVHFPEEKRVWKMLAIGTTFDFLGEATWTYFEVVRGIELPSPSTADIFWIAAYLFLIGAVWAQLKTMFNPGQTNRVIFSIAIGALALLGLGLIFVKTIKTEGIDTGTLVDFVYPLLDTIQLTLSILVIIPLSRVKSKLVLPWILIAASFFSFIIYDFTYAYLRAYIAYYTGATVDIIYMLAYTLMCAAGATKTTRAEKQYDKNT
jgi:hypothetical protein